MAFNTRGGGGSKKTYLNIYQGNLVLEYNVETELEKKLETLGLDPDNIKVRQRTKGRNEGKDVFYYVLYDVSGLLTNITLKENDFGEFMELEFTDVDEVFSVSLGDVYSRMAKDFIRRMGGLDLNSEIVFGVWSISADEADNGKAKSGVRMYQDDEKIDYHIEYDDLPEPSTKMKGRKKIWDFTDQENYLYEALTDWKDENFGKEVADERPEKVEETPTKKRTPRKPVKAKVEDDLPF